VVAVAVVFTLAAQAEQVALVVAQAHLWLVNKQEILEL